MSNPNRLSVYGSPSNDRVVSHYESHRTSAYYGVSERTSRRRRSLADRRSRIASMAGSVDGMMMDVDIDFSMDFAVNLGLPDGEKNPDGPPSDDPPDYVDANLVDWDGPDDPENPFNWPYSRKITHVLIAGFTAFFANMTATAFAPAAGALRQEFGITDPTLSAFTVSIYLLGFTLGPLVIAPLSEHYGRRIIYTVCLFLTIVFLVGCSESRDVGAFLVCRLITGMASSGPGTIGAGTIADVMRKEQRGGAMAIFAIAPLMSNTVGPLVAGPVTAYLGWRWLFRIIYISTSIIFVVAQFFTSETYTPLLLQRKAARLRKLTGNEALHSEYDTKGSPLAALQKAVARPTKMLFLSPIVWSLGIYCAFTWGLLILLFTTFPEVYSHSYGFTQARFGIPYIGQGVGMAIGAVSFGVISDKLAKARAADATKTSTPEDRLRLMVWFTPVSSIGFFWFGWAAYYHLPSVVPIIGTSFIGFGALYIVMPIQMYLVDAFGPGTAASAIAANTVMRSTAATFLPLAGPKLYEALNLGWGNSLLGFLSLGFSVLPIFFFKYGAWMRTKWPVNF